MFQYLKLIFKARTEWISSGASKYDRIILPYTRRSDRRDCHSGRSCHRWQWHCDRVCSGHHRDHCWRGWRLWDQRWHQHCSLLRSIHQRRDTRLHQKRVKGVNINKNNLYLGIISCVGAKLRMSWAGFSMVSCWLAQLCSAQWICSIPTLTFATLTVTTTVVKTEKIHNILRRQRVGVSSVHGPERGVGVDAGPAVLLQSVQVQPGVACVTSVLK